MPGVRNLFIWALCCLFFLSACESDDEASPSTTFGDMAGGDTDVPEADMTPPIEAPMCADVTFSEALPGQVTASTGDGDDDGPEAPCVNQGTGGSNDLVVFFVAPDDGDYLFSTVGSDFDTVLHARTGDCTGDVLGCNDDSVEQAAELALSLTAGQSIVLLVDGFNRSTGTVVLSISTKEQVCDDGEDDDGDGAIDCADTDCFLSCEDAVEWPEEWRTYEEEVLALTNEVRAMGADCGGQMMPPVGPLEMDQYLVYSSRIHGRDMGVNAYFEHESQDGRTPTDRMRQVGFSGDGPTGENIAAGQMTPDDVMESWINSPGHCRNIMDGDYRVLGVGYVEVDGSPFTRYWVQNFGGSH